MHGLSEGDRQILFFSFNDMRVIRRHTRTMLLFPSLYILLFPSLDIVRTDVCATHYATPHSFASYYCTILLCTDNACSFCARNLLARNNQPRSWSLPHSLSPYSSHTRCCAACVWSVTVCAIALKRVEGKVSE